MYFPHIISKVCIYVYLLLGTPERTLYRSNSVPGPDSSESQPKETGRPVSDCSAEQSSSLGSLAKIEDNAWDTVIGNGYKINKNKALLF